MAELKKKDQELDGTLISEFGEGESEFMVLRHAIYTDNKKYPTSEYDNGRIRTSDHLIIAPDGFKVLRVKVGKFMKGKDYYQLYNLEQKPTDYDPEEEVLDHNQRGNALNDAVQRFIQRGNADFRADRYTQAYINHYSLEGSGYKHEDQRHQFNFGKDAKNNDIVVKFRGSPYGDQSTVSYEWPQYTMDTFVKQALGDSPHPESERMLRSVRDGEAELILNPNPAEEAEIMKTNIEEAKAEKDRREAAKLTEEAKKIADAEEAQKPQREKVNQEEARKKKAEEQVVAQSQAADSALDLLSKL